MNKEITFTVWELLNVFGIAGSQEGNAAQMRRWWRILDALEPPEDQKSELGWQEVGEMGVTVNPLHFDLVYVVTLTEKDFKLLAKAVVDFNGWRAGGVSGGHRHRMEKLFDKMEV